MCGRFALHADRETLETHYRLGHVPVLEPRFNIAPSQPIAVVRDRGQGRELALLRWGLVPHWAKDPKIGQRLINARAETLSGKPSFRDAFRRRRCLVPASGYYEWQKRAAGKQPHYLYRRDGAPLTFAGLWEHWRDADTSLSTCAIITTAANAGTRHIHDRMPAVLESADHERWLHDGDADLLAPADDRVLAFHAVSPTVNDPRNEGPELIVPS